MQIMNDLIMQNDYINPNLTLYITNNINHQDRIGCVKEPAGNQCLNTLNFKKYYIIS